MQLASLEVLLHESTASPEQLVAQYQPTLETIQALKDRSAEFYSTDPAEALRIAKIAHALSQFLPIPAPALGAWALANAHIFTDHFRDSALLFEEARQLYLDIGYALDAARMCVGYVGVLAYKGEIERALELATECEPILRMSSHTQPEDLTRLSNLLMNVGIVYELQGAYEDSLDIYEQQIQIAQKLDNQMMLGELYQNKGCTLIQLNAFDEALEAFEAAEKIFIPNEQFLELTRSYPNQALLFTKMQQYDLAKHALAKAQALLPSLDEQHKQRHLLAIWNGLLCIQINESVDDKLITSIQHAQKAFKQNGPLELEKLAWVTLGNCYLDRKNREGAYTAFHKALGLNTQEQDNLIAFQSWYGLAQLAEQQNQIDDSADHYYRAIEQIESTREEIDTDLYRAGFLTDKLTVYHDLANLYISSGQMENAFRTAERAKARVIAEKLSTNVTQQVIGERLTSETFAPTHDNEINIEEVRRHLSAHTLLYYHIVREKIWVFVIDQSGLQKHLYVAEMPEIQTLQESFVQSTERMLEMTVQFGTVRANRNAGALNADANRSLQALYLRLIRPLEDLLVDGQALYISTDGPLHAIPFHALYDGSHHLVEQRAISYVPSATVLDLCMQPQDLTKQSPSILLFGYDNKQFDENQRVEISQLSCRNEISITADQVHALPSTPTSALRKNEQHFLPAVESELDWLTDLFPAAKRYSGEEATASHFLETAPTHTLLHFAAHAHFRVDKPMQSAFTLADRPLTLAEINALQLKADLVVLSGCETSHGHVRGTDLLSLASGFLSAGARSLLVSLWRVEDGITATLMSEFYKALIAGESRGESLRKAQCSILAAARKTPDLALYAHPAYWAPFTLIGSAEPLSLRANSKLSC